MRLIERKTLEIADWVRDLGYIVPTNHDHHARRIEDKFYRYDFYEADDYANGCLIVGLKPDEENESPVPVWGALFRDRRLTKIFADRDVAKIALGRLKKE